jgi:hypothetical protein
MESVCERVSIASNNVENASIVPPAVFDHDLRFRISDTGDQAIKRRGIRRRTGAF